MHSFELDPSLLAVADPDAVTVELDDVDALRRMMQLDASGRSANDDPRAPSKTRRRWAFGR